jgi:hypothetical protein
MSISSVPAVSMLTLVRRIIVAFDRALRGHGRVAVDMDQREVGEAVLVLLAFDEKEDLLTVFGK